ncbi:nucleotide sugar dehydrogenase [Morganella morganii]|uniref:nucleotide sugar dehydrogenase n=1 Tax=Morganella morganii TaxID=582 RepID=UPI003EB7E7A0
MSSVNYLSEKISNNSAVVAIIGMGYVGLPLMLRYSEIGFKVIGFDIDKNKIDMLNSGKSYIEHIPECKIQSAINSNFEATSDFSKITSCDILILCVPTPLNKYREPDISYIINTTNMLTPYLRKGQLLSLESTTYPGTTEEELLPRIQENNLVVGEDIFLVYSPEREDPGNENYNTKTIPKVIGGHTENCLKLGIQIYQKAIEKIVPESPRII